MSSIKLCWSYITTAAQSPQVGEKQSCKHRPWTVSSETRCQTAGQRLDCCKRRVQTEPDAALSDTKRRKLDDKRQPDNTAVIGWSRSYPVSHGESCLHSSAIKNRPDHLLPNSVMQILFRDSSATAELTPRAVITGLQGADSKSQALKLTHAREDGYTDVQEFPTKSIVNENLLDGVKVRFVENKVNGKNWIESSPDAGNGHGDKRDDSSSIRGRNVGRTYTDTTRRHTLPGKRQENTVNIERSEGAVQYQSGTDSKVEWDSSRCFLLLIDRRLHILYISENVWHHLGYQQMNMLGHSLEEYIHPNDLLLVRKQLRDDQSTTVEENVVPEWRTRRRVLNVAMRVNLQNMSRSCPQEHGYALVEWNVKLNFKKGPHGARVTRLIGLCRPTRLASLLSSRMDGNMFTSRHDLSFRFTFCDHRIINLTGYEPADLIGWAPYHFINPWDAAIYKQCLQTLISEGASISRSYRFLSRSGIWVGMVTQATVVYDTRCKPRYIVCKNHIVRHEKAKQKLDEEKEDFLRMKCLGFSIDGDQPVVKQVAANQSFLTNKQKLNKLGSHMFMKQSFDSDQPNNLFYPWSSSNIQEKFIRIPGLDVKPSVISTKPLFGMTLESVQNLRQETIVSTSFDYHTSTNKLPLDSENKNVQYGESKYVQQADADLKSMNSICETDQLDTTVDFCQELTSKLLIPLEKNTADTMCFNQVSGRSNPVDQFLLTDAFPAPPWTQIEYPKLRDTHMTDCQSAASHQRNADNKYAELAADKESQIVIQITEENRQRRQSFQAYSALGSAHNVSNSVNDTCLFHNPLALCNLPQENILSPSAGDLQQIPNVDCHKMANPPRNMLSGKLASLLQMEPVPTSSNTQGLKEEILKHASQSLEQEKNALSNAFIQSNVYSSNHQSSYNRTATPETDIISDSVMCVQQISSVSKLPLLGHHFLSPPSIHVSSSHINQVSSEMLYNSKSETKMYNSKSETENPSLHVSLESQFLESDYMNDPNGFISIMTNKKYDPFLNQTSFRNLNPTPSTDQTYAVASSRCSVNSHFLISQTSAMEPDRQSDLEFDFSSAHDFVDSSSALSDTQFVSECFGAASLTSERLDELDTFLDNASSNSCLVTHFNPAPNNQTMLFTEQLSFEPKLPVQESQVASDTTVYCGSNDSSDSDTLVPASLLRTLLDKEGNSVQGPLTRAEWLLEQALRKQSDMRKAKMSYPKTEFKKTDNRKARSSKSVHRKSVNLPLPMSPHAVKVNLSKSNLQHRKPTKELPLPVSSKAVTQHQSMSLQENSNTESIHQTNNELNNVGTNHSDQSSQEVSNGYDFPDDLLDMAMEYCASMEADQEDALITDLTDNFLSEDHFHSLCGSPSQDLQSVCSSNTHHQPGSLTLSLPFPNTCLSKESNVETSSNENMPMNFLESHCSNVPESVSSLKCQSSQNNTNTVNSLKTSQVSQTNSRNGGSKLSLLRTAVMTPDVDKLIKHIPLGNVSKYSANHHSVVAPKGMKLQEHSILTSAQVSHSKMCHIPSISAIKSQSLIHSHRNYNSRRNASGDKATLDYVCKTALSKGSIMQKQQLSNCLSSTASNGLIKTRSGSSPFVLKISIHQGCSAKVIKSSKMSENNINQKLNYFTPRTTARAADTSTTDTSTTQPVSVIIMRKDNNRPRRSKSIAVQTDNEPWEKYPEFEHSFSDTFLYPSVIVCSPSSTASGECQMSPTSTPQPSPTSTSRSSPASTSQPSPTSTSQSSRTSTSRSSPTSTSTSTSRSSSSASMSELEKCLRSHLSHGSSSSTDEDFQILPNASFLQRLLMGQLSKDQYQHLDKQMIEAEKGVLISSGVL